MAGAGVIVRLDGIATINGLRYLAASAYIGRMLR